MAMIHSHCDEVGKCWFWKGALDGHGRPQTRHDGRNVYVRRLVRELTDGVPLQRGIVAAAECGHKLCVSPECSVATTTKGKATMAANRGAYNSAAKTAKMTATKRARSHISEEVVDRVRSADGSSREIAARENISISHVKAIRRGLSRRPLGSPFAGLFTGLMAANDSKRRAA